MSNGMGEHREDGPGYLPQGKIENTALFRALTSLYILGKDIFLRMQANNLQLIDKFITDLEYQTLRELIADENSCHSLFLIGPIPNVDICCLRATSYVAGTLQKDH